LIESKKVITIRHAEAKNNTGKENLRLYMWNREKEKNYFKIPENLREKTKNIEEMIDSHALFPQNIIRAKQKAMLRDEKNMR